MRRIKLQRHSPMCNCTSWMRHPNSGLPEFGNIIVQVGNSRLGCAGPESILPVVVMDPGLARSLSSGRALRGPVGAPRNDEELFPRLGHLLDPARQHRPIGAGPQALQQVHEARVVANQYPRLVVLDALNNAQRGGGRRDFCDGIETLDRLRAARIVGDAGAGAGVAHDIGGNAAGMHHGQLHRARGHLQLVPQTFGKAAHREFRRGIGGLPRRRDDAEDARQVDDMGFALARQMRQERACGVHHAQKLMFISQSICAWSISLNWPSRATPALLTTMLSPGWADVAACAKSAICCGSLTSTRCVVTFCEWARLISAATVCKPASSRSASATSQPRAASSSASARPMPLAAPVTAAADPRIAVIEFQLHVGKEFGWGETCRKHLMCPITLIRPTGFGNRAPPAPASSAVVALDHFGLVVPPSDQTRS